MPDNITAGYGTPPVPQLPASSRPRSAYSSDTKMDSREKSLNIFLLTLLPFALASMVWAAIGFAPDRLDAGFVTLALLTIFCTCYLRVQLPRVNIHLTISDGLIILTLLLYGGPAALLLTIFETAIASFHLRWRGITIKPKTILTNILISPLPVFAATKVISFVFGPLDIVLSRNEQTSYIWLLGTVASSLFFVNSVLVSIYSSLKKERPFWKVWTDNCFSALVMYLTGAIVAGVTVKAVRLENANIYLLAGIVLFFGVVYLTFRRFVEDARRTADKAKQAEFERAEQAEQHVVELQHYVEELERSREALQASHENFRHAAYHDALTGLPNRNYFIDTIKDLLLQCHEEPEKNFAVLFLDLRNFKTINDSLGHSVGDRLIKNVAKRLEGVIRESDMAARFSGDKFGVILVDLSSREEATNFADRLAVRLADPYTLDGRQVFTSAKIGIAYGNSKYPEAEDLLRDADIAMYYAKDNKDNYVIFDQKMHIRAVTRLQLETDLRLAIERNEFELYYQPIIGLDSAQLVGFEALVRWNHPQRGIIPPNEFIHIGESTGLIIPMTVQILTSACKQIVAWQEQHPERPLSIAVNLSGKHFGHPSLVEQINTVIDDTGIDPANLKLELTESAVMEDAQTAILMLRQIKETGVQISIDDFGTGYSSLSYLHQFPIDQLKVDRSFVSAMEENTQNGEIVRTVVTLAKALRLKVVAEGIESIHQYHQLRVLGCEYGQGFLFSKPLPVCDIERLLADPYRWLNIIPASQHIPPMGRERQQPWLRLAQ